jgi:hypothetical protein
VQFCRPGGMPRGLIETEPQKGLRPRSLAQTARAVVSARQ